MRGFYLTKYSDGDGWVFKEKGVNTYENITFYLDLIEMSISIPLNQIEQPMRIQLVRHQIRD